MTPEAWHYSEMSTWIDDLIVAFLFPMRANSKHLIFPHFNSFVYSSHVASLDYLVIFTWQYFTVCDLYALSFKWNKLDEKFV